MSAHTPGPWFGRPRHDPVMISGSSGVGLEIAFSCAGAGSRREEYKANARLIAAAPELLEEHKEWSERFGLALVLAMQGDYTEVDSLAKSFRFDFCSGAPKIESAAIAKATGATP